VSTRLVILGLLRKGPLHGYEIKRLIERSMGDWTSIAFGSIYFALAKLTEEGFIERVATEKRGRRPSRSVYAVTEAGRVEFLSLLKEVWAEPERHYFSLDLGLFFMRALSREEILGYLARRTALTRTYLQHVEDHRAETMGDKRVPPIAGAIFDHTRAHLEAELAWIKTLTARVKKGELP